jgi:hypothetical protein
MRWQDARKFPWGIGLNATHTPPCLVHLYLATHVTHEMRLCILLEEQSGINKPVLLEE